ncbi:DNA-directed RNA polymerase I subunit RPA34 [Echeneis naucrates]|uniref:DNA-directed RNA polymerase I subunit RPA34 n=1 Tax=Echeneis naucrates TaxID=173247 RepID=UPI0011133AB4|nr:DNA-directed RNA polymerase I subunit RPA34 [Echeneis naucrates]
MLKDISSSSEDDSPATTLPAKQKESDEKATRYRCPADFVSFCHKPCSSTLAESLKDKKNELWLIKAPVNFNPECFSGIKVPLSGLQTMKVPSAAGGDKTGSRKQTYGILASSHTNSELRLLTSNKHSSGAVFGPTFSGLLNVCEDYGGSSANWAPQAIPTAPAPSIPLDLKQRFQPFGCKTPTLTCVAEDKVEGATFSHTSTNLCPLAVKRSIEKAGYDEEEQEGRKKKKKRKKEKSIKIEREETVSVKEEPVDEIQDDVTMALPVQEGDILQKRKKKKHRKQEEVEEGVKVEEVVVKCEPMDSSFGDAVEVSGKKKKKKKKSKTDND